MLLRTRRIALRVGVACLWILLAVGSVAQADPLADVAASNKIIQRVQTVLGRLGFTGFEIGGGAALSLAMAARQGAPLAWNDIDIRMVAPRKLDEKLMKKATRALTRGGQASLLPPGTLEFIDPEYNTVTKRTTLHSYGMGLRMADRTGARYDIAVMRSKTECRRSGFINAERLFIPLGRNDSIERILTRLKTGSAEDVVARGNLGLIEGNALSVLAGKVSIDRFNQRRVLAQPELVALRFLRATDKLAGMKGGKVEARRDLAWLERNLPKAMAHAPESKDPSYVMQVSEQAAKLLKSKNGPLLTAAKRMGLDLPALAQGKLTRR